MPFRPISPCASCCSLAKITQIVVTGLLCFLVVGCVTHNLAVAPVGHIPFWAVEYSVRTQESNHVVLAYGWRSQPPVKELIEAYLSDEDRKSVDSLFQSVLKFNPIGVTSSWDSPTTGYSATVTPIRMVTPKDQPPCRDFVTVVNIGGNEARGYGRYIKETGTACREDGGTWHVLEN